MPKKKTSTAKSTTVSKKAASKKEAAKPVFEQSLAELRTIVASLEQGSLTLSGSLEQYEQGVKCLKQCYQALDEAQRKIEILIDLDQDGRLVTAPFDDSASRFASGSSTRNDSDEETGDEVDEAEVDEDDCYDDESRTDSNPDQDVDDPNRLF